MRTQSLLTPHLVTVKQVLLSFFSEEHGQDMVEYTLLIAALALATAGLMSGSSLETKGIFSTMTTALSSATISAS